MKLKCPATCDHEVKIKKLIKLDILEINNEFVCYACRK